MDVRGTIIRGNRYGTTLGYPTANIKTVEAIEGGIYAARAHIDGETHFAAVFVDSTRHLLEAHLLDFSRDIYGSELRVVLEKKLRDSKRFEDEEDLKVAIAKDISDIRSYFKSI